MKIKLSHDQYRKVFIFNLLALFLSGFVVLSGCSTQTFYYGKVYLLNPDQILAAQEKAKSGNSEAAMALYRHYNFGLIDSDEAKAEYWFQMAAKNGDQVAVKNLKSISERKGNQ